MLSRQGVLEAKESINGKTRHKNVSQLIHPQTAIRLADYIKGRAHKINGLMARCGELALLRKFEDATGRTNDVLKALPRKAASEGR